MYTSQLVRVSEDNCSIKFREDRVVADEVEVSEFGLGDVDVEVFRAEGEARVEAEGEGGDAEEDGDGDDKPEDFPATIRLKEGIRCIEEEGFFVFGHCGRLRVWGVGMHKQRLNLNL